MARSTRPCAVSIVEPFSATKPACRTIIYHSFHTIRTNGTYHLIVACGFVLTDTVIAWKYWERAGRSLWAEYTVGLNDLVADHIWVRRYARSRVINLLDIFHAIYWHEQVEEPGIVTQTVKDVTVGAIRGRTHATLHFIGRDGCLGAVVSWGANARAGAVE